MESNQHIVNGYYGGGSFGQEQNNTMDDLMTEYVTSAPVATDAQMWMQAMNALLYLTMGDNGSSSPYRAEPISDERAEVWIAGDMH